MRVTSYVACGVVSMVIAGVNAWNAFVSPVPAAGVCAVMFVLNVALAAFAFFAAGVVAQNRAVAEAISKGHGWPPIDPATIPPPPEWRAGGYTPVRAPGPRGLVKPPQGGTGVVDSPTGQASGAKSRSLSGRDIV